MNFRNIKISELTELVKSPQYMEWDNIPVSPARAISQSQNPFSMPEDVALIIALDDNKKILGFIGALPSKINSAGGNRIAWVSNWWVAESARGRGIAKMLLQHLTDAWGNNLAFQDLTTPTLNIINKEGQFQVFKKDGVLVDFRPGFISRINKYGYSSLTGNLLSRVLLYSGIPWFADKVYNLFLFFPRYLWLRKNRCRSPVEITEPDEKDFSFIRTKGEGDFHIPDAAELDMPLWLVEPSAKNRFLAKKYPYSSFAFSFKTFWLRWEKNNKIQALLMLSLRDGVMKTNFVYCEEEFKKDLPRELLGYCIKNKHVNTIVTAQPIFAWFYAASRLPVFRKRQYTRYLAASKEIMNLFQADPVFQDGVGDYWFT